MRTWWPRASFTAEARRQVRTGRGAGGAGHLVADRGAAASSAAGSRPRRAVVDQAGGQAGVRPASGAGAGRRPPGPALRSVAGRVVVALAREALGRRRARRGRGGEWTRRGSRRWLRGRGHDGGSSDGEDRAHPGDGGGHAHDLAARSRTQAGSGRRSGTVPRRRPVAVGRRQGWMRRPCGLAPRPAAADLRCQPLPGCVRCKPGRRRRGGHLMASKDTGGQKRTSKTSEESRDRGRGVDRCRRAQGETRRRHRRDARRDR